MSSATAGDKKQLRAAIDTKLVQTGEKERLKELLRTRLIESGWRDELKNMCKESLHAKGLEQVTVEELITEITPVARAKVPEAVKAELLQRIRKFLAEVDV
ncbi:enhancer of yellow 2 transcription factor [Cladochytrium replicatum]|nr:enhancer of yellow 2 transcription factor [Cladochytrium replicatum]